MLKQNLLLPEAITDKYGGRKTAHTIEFLGTAHNCNYLGKEKVEVTHLGAL